MTAACQSKSNTQVLVLGRHARADQRAVADAERQRTARVRAHLTSTVADDGSVLAVSISTEAASNRAAREQPLLIVEQGALAVRLPRPAASTD